MITAPSHYAKNVITRSGSSRLRRIRKNPADYLSDTDAEEYQDHPKLSDLSPEDRKKKILTLWRSAINFATSVSVFLEQLRGLQAKLQIFGRQMVATQDFVKEKIAHSKYILLPNSSFKTAWNFLLIIALLYTSSIMPYNVAFIDEDPLSLIITNGIIDTFFWCDIILNFISAYERPNGILEVRPKQIVKNYLFGWFLLDFISTLPTQAIESIFINENETSTAKANKLARILRLPRLYSLTRLMRILRVLKLLRYNRRFRILISKVNLSAQMTKMVRLLLTATLLIHIVSCLWYFFAKLDRFNDGTWIARQGIQNEDSHFFLYCTSWYWALQVLTTVGFGDFGAGTTTEYIFNVLWMIIGVGYYQLLFGQVISIIQSSMMQEDLLTSKLKALEGFANEIKLEESLYFNIRLFLINNYVEIQDQIDEQSFLKDLPTNMRDELLFTQFGTVIDRIHILRESDDNEFTWDLIQGAQKISFSKDEMIYLEDDFADTIFMIHRGQVALYTRNGMLIAQYSEGELIGDQDTLLNENRDAKCLALTECDFFVIQIDHLENVLKKSPTMENRMRTAARQKRTRHQKKMAKLEKQYPVYGLDLSTSAAAKNETQIKKLQKYGVNLSDNLKKEDSKQQSSKIKKLLFDAKIKNEEMKAFITDFNTQYSHESMDIRQLEKVHKFLTSKVGEKNEKMTQDAEFVRGVTLLMRKSGAFEQLSKLEQDKILDGVKRLQDEYLPREGAEGKRMGIFEGASVLSKIKKAGLNLKKLINTDPKERRGSQQASMLNMLSQAMKQKVEKQTEMADFESQKQEIAKVMEYQRLVEQDERLGMPEAQAAMEVINGLNADMNLIAKNMKLMVGTLERLNKVSQDNMWNLESQTIDIIEEQSGIEQSTEALLNKLTQNGELQVTPAHRVVNVTDYSTDNVTADDKTLIESDIHDMMIVDERQQLSAAQQNMKRKSRMSLVHGKNFRSQDLFK